MQKDMFVDVYLLVQLPKWKRESLNAHQLEKECVCYSVIQSLKGRD